jgi:hypothetical protein
MMKTSIFNDTGLARGNKYICNVYLPNAKTDQGRGIIGALFGGRSSTLNIPGIFTGTPGLNIDVAQPIRNLLTSNSVTKFANKLGRPVSGFIFQNIIGRGEQLSLFCSGAEIPSRDVEATEQKYYGERRQIGYNHIHPQLVLQYYCSEDLRERRFFEEWQNMVFDPESKAVGYYKEYIGRVEVQQWDYGLTTKMSEYRFNEAYVTNVGNLNYDYNNGDIQRISISFNYRNYTRIL